MHPSTEALLRYFDWQHLPPGLLQDTSATCQNMAQQMVSSLPDCPELAAGLRKLLEAKDCFVRAALPK